MKFVNHLEIEQHQLLRAVFHKVTADPIAPAPVEGQVWYRTDTKALKIQKGAAADFVWTGAHLLTGAGIEVASVNLDTGVTTIAAKTDGLTIDTDISDQLRVKPNGLNGTHLAGNASIAFSQLASLTSARILVGNASNVATSVAVSGDITITNAGVTLIGARKVDFGKLVASSVNGISVIGKAASGSGSFAEISASANHNVLMRYGDAIVFRQIENAQIGNDAQIAFSKLASTTLSNRVLGRMGTSGAVGEVQVLVTGNNLAALNSDSTLVSSKLIKDYIDSQITAGTMPAFQGDWNASTQSIFPGGALTKPGDFWYVSTAGTLDGRMFRVHDVIMARVANPTTTNQADYVFLESDKDLATETVAGWVTMATQAQMNTGVGGSVAVTPFRLQEYVNSLGIVKSHTELVGNGTLTQFDITHNFNTKAVTVQTYEATGGEQQVMPTISIVSTNVVRVAFSSAPAANTYRVVVKG